MEKKQTGKSYDYEIEISGVTQEFEKKDGKFLALDTVNLNVEQNEFICVVGPSGCGKTTLLTRQCGSERSSAASPASWCTETAVRRSALAVMVSLYCSKLVDCDLTNAIVWQKRASVACRAFQPDARTTPAMKSTPTRM